MRPSRVIGSLSRVSKRAGLTFALTFGVLFAVPAIASAGTVTTAGTVITYTGDLAGDTVTVTDSGTDSYTFAETLISESSTSCTDGGDNVTCVGTGWTSVVANLGGGNDVFTAITVNDDPFTINGEDDDDGNITGSSANDIINGGDASDDATATGLSGGPGDDIIDGGAGSVTGDIINGNDGNDWLYGGTEGPDDLNGGAGNDRMDGGQSSQDDVYIGGADLDRVVYGSLDPPGAPNFTYTCTAQAVVVTLDNATGDDSCADTGRDDEDVQSTVESVTGSTTADTITGSCGANTFAGDPGTTDGGGGGADTLSGDPAACAPNGGDFLGGGEGNDSFNCDGTGAAGFDTVTYGAPYVDAAAPGISVTLDDAANDGDGFGNTDNVNGDCERIIGSAQADTIDATGADQGVQLFGRLGGDTLTGSGFDDLLNGEDGTDVGNCGGGTDTAISIETATACEL